MEVDENIVQQFKDLTKDDAEFSTKCSKLAQDIGRGALTIVELVEQLGPLLIDPSPENRALGTWILTQILETLPPDHLDIKQLTFIGTFYADRLKDHHQVIPAILRGVIALLRSNQFPEGIASQILKSLFQNVSCQQQQQVDRQNIFKIFEILQEKHSKELCTLGLDYVYSVISAVDGERDPKNLLLLFKWYPKFLNTVDLRHLVEEAFEVMACYFPVDFKAPSQDPNHITRETLAGALNPCLCAIPEFADFCLPLALEKLDSSLDIAKLDSLRLLESGCSTFPATSYIQHSSEIWSRIQRELLNNPTPELESACTSTLIAVMRKISNHSTFANILKDICDTIKGNLLPDSRFFEPSAKLLLTVAGTSRFSATFITTELISILINTFNITTTIAHKIKVLQVLINFLCTYFNLFNSMNLDELCDVPSLCLKASIDENDELRIVAFEGLKQMAKFLPWNIRQVVYNNLQNLLVTPQNPQVRVSILNCFQSLSRYYSGEIKGCVINKIVATNALSLQQYLEALVLVASQEDFRDYVIDTLLNCLCKDREEAIIAIRCLRKLIEINENDSKIQQSLLAKEAVNKLVNWATNQGDASYCYEDFSFVVKHVIGFQSSEVQLRFVEMQLPKILASLKSCRKNYVVLLDAILCKLRRDVAIDYNFVEDLIVTTVSEKDHLVKNVAVQLLANLLNKCSDENFLQICLGKLENQDDFEILAWITKALVLRNHEKANNLINRLIEMLPHNPEVATSFRIIMNDNYDSMSVESYCNRTLLYRQKFFTVVTKKLCETYRPEFPSYLAAFGYLLEHAPRKAILLQFKQTLKLFILCLEKCQNPEVLLVLLQIIHDFTAAKENCILDNLDEFLTRVINLTTFDHSMKVRILALQCLQKAATSYPVFKLLPVRQNVLLQLGKCVDDRKRFVRREAVEARSIWYLLDAPI